MFPNTEAFPSAEASASATGTKSFLFDFEKGDFVVRDGKLIECDGNDAVKVWIEKILKTEKERYEIYDGTEYGCHLEDLIIGNNYPIAFIDAELKREIEEALLQNPCILTVSNFVLSRHPNSITLEMEVKLRDGTGNIISVTV